MKPAQSELIERSRDLYRSELQKEHPRRRSEDCDCGVQHKRLALAGAMEVDTVMVTALRSIGKTLVGAVICAECAHGRAILVDDGDLHPLAQLLFGMGYGL